ncbi:MAG TPA: twin-arginine translocase TatA/TatE family subunit [Gemmatimonadaceae bacterium]|nr:twin-arginine translocase TatA/TatE family subunit [Gemmatimonadaceae bacterium]
MELAIILVIVLVIFGAKRVPEIGASFGKGIREFKRSLSDVDNQIRQPDAKPADRLGAGGVENTTPNVREETTPEPKRLI